MNNRSDFLSFVKKQVGKSGGDEIRKWYNENVSNIGNYKWPWCAAGISYSASKSNIDTKVITPTASSSSMLINFSKIGRFKNRGEYTPTGGDIVIFKWSNATTLASHVGVVEYVEGNTVHTIEFNSGSSSDGEVCRWKYPLNYSNIVGYCVPDFKDEKVELLTKGYLRSKGWLDPKDRSSKKLIIVNKGDKVTFIKDDGYGWSKVKYAGIVGYIQNSKLNKKGISLFPYVEINATKILKCVRSNLKMKFAKNKKVTFICSVEKGKNKGKSIIRYKKIIYYIKNKYLTNFEMRFK